jgi:hypothetical protein
MSTKVDTVTVDGLELLLEQFQGSEKLRALLSSYLGRIQDLEDAAWPILGERNIDNATGHRLDGLGQIFNLARGGRNDTNYRLALKAEMAIQRSTGVAEDLLAIAEWLIQMTPPDYELVEYFPKSVYLRPVDFFLAAQDPLFITSSLKRSVSAGTQMLFVYSLHLDAYTFTLSTQASASDSSTTTGMAPDDQSTGGHLANSL